MTRVLDRPPFTPIEPVTEALHGVEIIDPYRWLEDQDSPRTRQWIEEQTHYTRAYFDGIPYRDRIRERVAELLSMDSVAEPWNVGDRYLFLRREKERQQPTIVMREGLFGTDTILVDPLSHGEGPTTAISIAGISPNGRFLAYSVRRGGADYSSLEIIDTISKVRINDRLPEAFRTGIAFAPDESGFYYCCRPVRSSRPNYRAVFWHRLGTPQSEDLEVFFAGEESNLNLWFLYSLEADVLCYVVCSTGKLNRTSVYLHKSPPLGKPRLLLEKVEGCFMPFFVRGQLVAYTDVAAPNFRIVAIDASDPYPTHWRDVVPQSERRIQQFAVAGDQIFITCVDRFTPEIVAFDTDGLKSRSVTIPNHAGSVNLLSSATRSNKLFYSYTSVSAPPTLYCYDTEKRQLSICHRPTVPFDGSLIAMEQVTFPSKDGTLVPLFLAARRDLLRAGCLPTFITGYGGFGSCATPHFTAFATFLIEQGFLFAVPAVRGGGELGEGWHAAAQREKRQNSFEDFIAATEWLVWEGRSIPGRIAIGGGSNAGLLMGAVITQRPDLFRAAILLGPLLDMTRYHLFDFAARWAREYGSPDDKQDFTSLLAYSPYHRVREGVEYPAVLFISGDSDTRCNPMHARKMTARVQRATSSRHPILLDYKPNWGHMPVQPLGARIDAITDRLAFVCRELSVKVQPMRYS